MKRSTVLMLESIAKSVTVKDHGFQSGIRDSDDPFFAEVQLSNGVIEELMERALTRPLKVNKEEP